MEKRTNSSTVSNPNRLFIGDYPGGIVFSDTSRESNGDYRRVAFLPYESLEFIPGKDADTELLSRAKAYAAAIQARVGQWHQVSACGQRVLLGKYVVLNENTLAYLQPERPNLLGVLHGSALKGGHDWKNGTVAYVPGIDRIRPATRADFYEYRVEPPSGFFN